MPTLTHDAAEDVRVDVRGERHLAPGALADACAEALGRRLVELDRARDLHRQHPVLLAPTAARTRWRMRKITGMRWFSISSLRKFRKRSSAPSSSALERLLLLVASRSRARRRTPPARGCSSSASANWPSCSRSSSSLPCSRATSNSERAYTSGELLHQLLAAPEEIAGEVELAQRLLDQPLLVGVVERLARDLLGRHASSGRRPRGGCRRARAWSPPRCRARRAWRPRRAISWPRSLASCSCASAAWRARWTISSACARASFRRSRYSASSSSASSRVRSAVSIDSSIAFWRRSSASLMRGKASLREQHHRDAEHEQRPDHQADARLDQEAAAGGEHGCDGCARAASIALRR